MVPIRAIFGAALLLLALLLPQPAQAQGTLEATRLLVGGPEQVQLGDNTTVQAVLVDSASRPIAKETIYFSIPASFLTGKGDMVVARAVTNENGQAVAEFENDVTGSLTLRAEFPGDDRYAPSNATAPISVGGDIPHYTEQVGVQIPGLNQPPPAPRSASITQPLVTIAPDVPNLWPSMSGWPIAVVLITVWSLYVFAVGLIFRIAAPGRSNRGGYNAETGRFE